MAAAGDTDLYIMEVSAPRYRSYSYRDRNRRKLWELYFRVPVGTPKEDLAAIVDILLRSGWILDPNHVDKCRKCSGEDLAISDCAYVTSCKKVPTNARVYTKESSTKDLKVIEEYFKNKRAKKEAQRAELAKICAEEEAAQKEIEEKFKTKKRKATERFESERHKRARADD